MVNQLDAMEGPSREAVAARIRALQKAMKLNGVLFAKRCKISEQTLSNYKRKNGYRRPSIDQAGKIAAGTGVSVDWILYGRKKDELPHNIYEAIYGPER